MSRSLTYLFAFFWRLIAVYLSGGSGAISLSYLHLRPHAPLSSAHIPQLAAADGTLLYLLLHSAASKSQTGTLMFIWTLTGRRESSQFCRLNFHFCMDSRPSLFLVTISQACTHRVELKSKCLAMTK